jgi:hypothetical protein
LKKILSTVTFVPKGADKSNCSVKAGLMVKSRNGLLVGLNNMAIDHVKMQFQCLRCAV